MFYFFNKVSNVIYYSGIHNAMISYIFIKAHFIVITFSTSITYRFNLRFISFFAKATPLQKQRK